MKQKTQDTLYFIHGSTAAPDSPEEFQFNLFDYLYDPNTKSSNKKEVGSGLDAYGPGIYAFGLTSNQVDQETYKNAATYAGTDKGAIIGFEVDMLDHDGKPVRTAERYPADFYDEGTWEEVIECFIEKLHKHHSYNEENLNDAVEQITSLWPDDPSDESSYSEALQIQLDRLTQNSGGNTPLKSVMLSDYDDPYDWESEMKATIELYDPASHIRDEGGPSHVVAYCLNRSENLWDMVKEVFNMTATISHGRGVDSYNNMFYQAVRETVPDMAPLRVAAVNDGHFFVVFDVDAITINSMEITRRQEPANLSTEILPRIVNLYNEYKSDIDAGKLEVTQLAPEIKKTVQRNHRYQFNGQYDKNASVENRGLLGEWRS